MSFQTITDILVSPKTTDLQVSNIVKDTQSNTNSISFSDLVQSYKDESKVEEKVVQESNFTEKEKSAEIESYDNEKSSKIDEKNQNLKDESESEEKIEVINDEKTATTEKKSLKISQIKTEAKKINLEQKNQTVKDEKKIPSKEKLTGKKESKLEKKDFSRIAELENQLNKDVQTVVPENVAENLNISDRKQSKAEKENNSEKEIAIDLQTLTEESENMKIAVQSNKEDSDVNFDFKDDNSRQKNVAKLDKDGKITVEDLRTEKSQEFVKDEKSNLKVTDVKFNNENTATITMDLNQADNNILSLNNQSAASQGSNFQSMLNNQIQANVPEFVKAGNIVLKDNDQGTINLILHPDDLGNVKIHLSMDGKSVTGHITVATKEALQVFKDNAETMREAFIKSGFENASFDVAYGNNGSNSQNMNFEQQQQNNFAFGQHVYNSSTGTEVIDSMLDDFIGNEEKFDNFSINIVA